MFLSAGRVAGGWPRWAIIWGSSCSLNLCSYVFLLLRFFHDQRNCWRWEKLLDLRAKDFLQTWLLPCLLLFLNQATHVMAPQNSKSCARLQEKFTGFIYFFRTHFSSCLLSVVCRCVICRLDYDEGDRVIILSCKHTYHSECINNWLQINKVGMHFSDDDFLQCVFFWGGNTFWKAGLPDLWPPLTFFCFTSCSVIKSEK